MATYSLKHVTHYDYHYPVALSHHAVYLEPKTLPYQTCSEYLLSTEPAFVDLRKRIDFFGNTMGLFSIQQEHHELIITSTSTVEVIRPVPDLKALTATTQMTQQWLSNTDTALDIKQYLSPSPHVPPASAHVAAFAREHIAAEAPVAQAVYDLAGVIKSTFTFDNEATDINTTVDDFFKIKRGVCQDFTHFMIACLRSLGLATRYVSGYILTHPLPGEPRLEGSDASHAWVSIYIPDYGWMDIDPTNNLICSDQHVTVAWGRDFSDVSLVRGAITGGGSHDLDIAVTMTPEDSCES